MKTENSRVKALASECANIVTKIELIEHANEEVQWYRVLEKDDVPLQDERSLKVDYRRFLQKCRSSLKLSLLILMLRLNLMG